MNEFKRHDLNWMHEMSKESRVSEIKPCTERIAQLEKENEELKEENARITKIKNEYIDIAGSMNKGIHAKCDIISQLEDLNNKQKVLTKSQKMYIKDIEAVNITLQQQNDKRGKALEEIINAPIFDNDLLNLQNLKLIATKALVGSNDHVVIREKQ